MVRFPRLKVETQKEQLNEWTRMAGILDNIVRHRLLYPLPAVDIETGRGKQLVCRQAVHRILNVGRVKWSAALATDNPEYAHGLRDRTGLAANKTKALGEVHELLHAFFGALKKEGVPFAMQVIREETGLTTRYEDPDEVCLLPHMSKHWIYAGWCWSRRWKVEKKLKAM